MKTTILFNLPGYLNPFFDLTSGIDPKFKFPGIEFDRQTDVSRVHNNATILIFDENVWYVDETKIPGAVMFSMKLGYRLRLHRERALESPKDFFILIPLSSIYYMHCHD